LLYPSKFLTGLSQNLLIAATGALLAYGANKTVTYVKNSREKRRFPVAGQYIAEYEDETQAGIQAVFAPATLKQAGLRITGTTCLNERCWILEGSIDPTGGYLSGIYRADNPYDKGVGNFFLEIHPDGALEGLWSGYDAENRKIHAGLYRFRKILPLQVTPITKHTVGPALSIAEKQLGDSYIQASDFLDSRHISLCAICGGAVAGFIVAKEPTVEDFRSLYPKIAEALGRQLAYTETIGFIASMATAPEFEKRGVAHALLQAGLARLEKAGQPLICTIGWKGKGTVAHIDGLVRKAGFQAVHEFADYWKEDSLKKGYKCPVCGDPPCHCSAVLFVRHTPAGRMLSTAI
jgi:ribosomal protein S18 acetylase RimI-like enzyme